MKKYFDTGAPIRFGLLGCGMISRVHAEAIEHTVGAVLVGVADADLGRAEDFASCRGVRAYSSYEEMLADEGIDVISVCTPSFCHASNAISALRAGKHVVLEKPMAMTPEEAEEVARESERADRLVSVVFQRRFYDNVTKVKKAIDEGGFGRIVLCNLSMKYYRNEEYYASSSWRGTLKYDGGAMMNQGIHGIDLVEYLVGEVKNVEGFTKTLCHKIEAEDTAVAAFELECGALGTICASTCTYPGFNLLLEIHGERGFVIMKDNTIERMMVDGKELEVESVDTYCGTASNPAAMTSEGHTLEYGNVVSALFGECELLTDAHEGARAIRLISRISSSSAKRT